MGMHMILVAKTLVSHPNITVTVEVVLEVVLARAGMFTVTCTARGGTVLHSSLTGPGGVNYTLQLIGIREEKIHIQLLHPP